MKNELAVRLKKAKRSGVEEGLVTMQNVTLVALDNVASDFMEEEKVGEFLVATEKEMQRVWSALMQYMGDELDLNRAKMHEDNAVTVAEYLLGWVDRIRLKWHMDG